MHKTSVRDNNPIQDQDLSTLSAPKQHEATKSLSDLKANRILMINHQYHGWIPVFVKEVNRDQQTIRFDWLRTKEGKVTLSNPQQSDVTIPITNISEAKPLRKGDFASEDANTSFKMLPVSRNPLYCPRPSAPKITIEGDSVTIDFKPHRPKAGNGQLWRRAS